MGEFSDSADVPWEGRTLRPHPFAGDTGQADPGLRAALDAVAESPLDPGAHRGVVAALAGARIYAPVLPTAVEHTTDESGLVHDNSSDMAMVRLSAEDGRECTPAFADIPALTSWSAEARPIPIESERLAAAAIEEKADLVVLDPGSDHPFLLRRPALWSFVKSEDWTPAWANRQVAAALAEAAGGFPWIHGLGIAPGSATVHVSGPELAVVLRVAENPGPKRLGELQEALSSHEDFVDLVDSLTVRLEKA